MFKLFVLLLPIFLAACATGDIEQPALDDDYQYYPDATSTSEEEVSDEVSASGAEGSTSTETTAEAGSSDGSDATYPDTAAPSLTSSEDATSGSTSDGGDDVAPTDEESILSNSGFDWNHVLITEVVTDPQQDHGESGSGNGIKFDATPGTGTVGSTDEFIEIFNGTDVAVDVSGWSINMTDGTDVTESFLDSDWENFFSAGGSLDVLQPGEFLVLGNPDGTINNTITVDLLSETGELINEIVADDANATDISDEAYYLTADGEWEMGAATPGFFPTLF